MRLNRYVDRHGSGSFATWLRFDASPTCTQPPSRIEGSSRGWEKGKAVGCSSCSSRALAALLCAQRKDASKRHLTLSEKRFCRQRREMWCFDSAGPWAYLRGALRAASFDHLVGCGEQRLRDGQAERLGGLRIYDQLKFGRLLDGEIAWGRSF